MESPALAQPTSEQPPPKPERNWKKILLVLLLFLFLTSLVGVGLYLLIPKQVEEPQQQTEKQVTPSNKKPDTFQGKVAFSLRGLLGNQINDPSKKEGVYISNQDGTGIKQLIKYPVKIKSDSTGKFNLTPYVSVIEWSPKTNYLGWIKVDPNEDTYTFQYVHSDDLDEVKSVNLGKSGGGGFKWSPNEKFVAFNLKDSDYSHAKSSFVKILDTATQKFVKEFTVGSYTKSDDQSKMDSSIFWALDNSRVIVFHNKKSKGIKRVSSFDISADYPLSTENTLREIADERLFVVNNDSSKIAYLTTQTSDYPQGQSFTFYNKSKLVVENLSGSKNQKVIDLSEGEALTPHQIFSSIDKVSISYTVPEAGVTTTDLVDIKKGNKKSLKGIAIISWSNDGKKALGYDGGRFFGTDTVIVFDANGNKLSEFTPAKNVQVINFIFSPL